MPRKIPAVAAILLLAILAVASEGVTQSRFRETTSVVVVEVPVQVTRGGEPVRGLTAADFEVIDGRKKQEIVGFDVVDLSLETGAVGELPVSARRHFLFLFDLSFSNPSSIVRARDAARELLDTLHVSDLVAVATYSARSGSRIVLGFTSDRRQAALAIDSLGLPQLVAEARDPLALMLTDLSDTRTVDDRVVTPTEDAVSGVASRGGDALGGIDPEAEIRGVITALEREVRRGELKQDILALAGSMTELATLLNSVEGRKHLLYLSEGFDSSQMIGLGLSAGEIARGQELNEQAMSGEYWAVDSEERFGTTSTLNQLEIMVREFVQSDVTIQAIDIGGLRAAGVAAAGGISSRGGEHGLSFLASSTGGEFYRNINDLGDAMGKMLERTSVTYVLAIQPKDLEADGSYRKLRVRLKGAARGARVVHRPGYFAPKPFGEQSVEERRMITAGLIMGGREGGSIASSVLAAPFPTDGALSYVPVLVEIDGSSLAAGTDGDVLPTELYAYALDDRGNVRDYFTRVLGLDLGKIGDQLRQTGFKYWGHFELAPGEYTVRVLVRNAAVGTTGLRSVDLEVPEADGIAVLPPLFPEPQGTWLLAREESPGDFDYPFLIGQEPFIPAARPVIAAGSSAVVSLVVYNPGDDARVTAELVAADGSRPAGGSLVLEERAAAGPGIERFRASYTCPEGVAAGDYELVVKMADASGGEQTASIPLRVTG